MEDYGIKVSRENENVLLPRSDRDEIWKSKYKTLLIAKAGTAVVTTTAAGGVFRTRVKHGLGYIPAFRVILLEDAHTNYGDINIGTDILQSMMVPGVHHVDQSANYHNLRTDALADSEDLILLAEELQNNAAIFTFRYMIFVNRAKLY